MKPADDPNIDYKALVQRGYDRCAAKYEEARHGEGQPELSLLMDRLGEGERVLDIGCGAGVPVARALEQRFQVTGVDLSSEMIKRARANVPEATFIYGDIMDSQFPAVYFDAVVSFYAIFHLPREEHSKLFRRIHRWLKVGGYFFGTVAQTNEPAYTEHDFFGETMYWSNFGLEDYQKLLTEIGFQLLESGALGHGFDADEDISEEHHPLIFAQRIG
ncbi:MAG: methyltransferase domain-containing protein [Anaerolineales bacterium]|nr:methyltransferase domain-containing protein [Chloroflexota bacterium]MBL6981399.1 methyltransferase domain-containing protein [Anaerolineales bacterium]